jgi:uncharacterized repeat protein (TIGR03803 family)
MSTIKSVLRRCITTFGALSNAVFIVALITIGPLTPALAQSPVTTLYAFSDWATTGYFPRGGLAMDAAGALYGTTRYGGEDPNFPGVVCGNCSTVYKLSPPGSGQTAWTYQLLHTMTPEPIQGYSEDGIAPDAPLTTFQNVMYGVNSAGGDTQCGCGNIFSVTPNGTYTILHVFDPISGANGMTPIGGLLIDTDGSMYGTTSAGGSNYSGTVYKMPTSGGSFQILYNLPGSSTAGPEGELIFGQDGALYGTAYGGGAYGQGYVFRLTKDGNTFQDLYDFQGVNQPGGGHDGADPEGRLALGSDGTIYGTTTFGGTESGYGTIWSIKNNGSNWVYTQLYIFQNGELPHSGVVLASDGALYGTGAGGGQYGSGVFYKLVPPATAGGQWTYHVLHSFIGLDANGDTPYAALLYANGKFYGANISGGDLNCGDEDGCGTVFEFSPSAVPHDFNGDGYSDMLWRNTSGNMAIWEMQGSTILNPSSSGLGGVATTWSIVGQHDFNGDGKADLLWHDTSGNLAIWEMNGTTILNSNSTGLGAVSTAWAIAGVGDFNGDGMADILWRDTSTGAVAIWEMNGTTILNPNASGVGTVATNWSVVGVGDFNGDGKADILWKNNTNGNLAIYLMNGTTVASSATFANEGSYSVVGIGDFNGDGKSDILFRDGSGDIAIWEMNGTTILNPSSSGVGNLSTAWSVAETGDFNGDGHSDILWRDSSGDIAIWFMNGTTLSSGGGLGAISTTYTIQGTNAD